MVALNVNEELNEEPDGSEKVCSDYERLWLQAELEKDKLAEEVSRLRKELEYCKKLLMYGNESHRD